MGQMVPYIRKLTREDMVRMCIPRRFWDVRADLVSEETFGEISVRVLLRRYVDQMDEMRRMGRGILFWGPNGTGKTSIAVLVAREFRRRGHPVLFMEAAELKRVVVGREMFDEDQTYWDRALNVPVLVVDDLGKGTVDETGFGMRLVDELVRHRTAHRLVTIITTNLRPTELSALLMPSTVSALREQVLPVEVAGRDRRVSIAAQASESFFAR